MKKWCVVFLSLICVLKLDAKGIELNYNQKFDSSVLYVMPKPGISASAFITELKKVKSVNVFECTNLFAGHKDSLLGRILKLKFKNNTDAAELLNSSKLKVISTYIEYAPIHKVFLTPNDLHANQWHLKKINAEAAWSIRTGASSVLLAIVDDAVDTKHEDLKNVIYKNISEIPGNGIDDDANGYKDDVYGWNANYKNGNANPPFLNAADFTHGTHCAGIASVETNNNIGIASIAYNVRVLPVSCADTTMPGFIMAGFEGIVYAADAGAKVISLSWGGGGFSNTGQITINYALGKGAVICAAAGNSNVNTPMYPAAYTGVISVAASDQNDKKASFSNYGSWIDISAPGVNIWSTVTDGNVKYDYMSGTSMACPLTAGLCALMLSQNSRLTANEIETCLKQTADNINSLNPSYNNLLGAGRINALNALRCVKPLFADFKVNSTLHCENDVVQLINQSSVNVTSYFWKITGAIPNTSNLQSPLIQFPTTGFYTVKLVVSDGVNFDSIEKVNYIEVRKSSAQMVNTNALIRKGETAFISVKLNGNAPWSFKVSDGNTVLSFNNINSSPFYFDVSPLKNSKYYLTSFTDSKCTGIYTDTAYVKVDSLLKSSNPSSCGNFRLYTKIVNNGGPDYAHNISLLSNGDFMVSGITNQSNTSGDDFFVNQYNYSDLSRIKKLVFGSTSQEVGYPIGTIEGPNKDLYTFGATYLNNPNTSFWTRINRFTNYPSYAHLSLNNNVQDQIRCAKKLSNGHMVFAGTSAITNDQAGAIYMCDTIGNRIWSHSFDASGTTEHFIDVTEMDKRIYAVGHSSYGSGSYGSFLIKFDFKGNALWQKYIDFANYDAAMYIQETHQHSILTAHWVSYNGSSTFGSEDFGIVHTDSNGNKIWSKVYGTAGKDEVSGLQKIGNYYYISGTTTNFDGGKSKLFLMKIDINGNIEWTKTYGANGEVIGKPLFAELLCATIDSGLILLGQKTNTNEDYVMLKLDACGNSNCPSADVVFKSVAENLTFTNSSLVDIGLLTRGNANWYSLPPSNVNYYDKCAPKLIQNSCTIKAKFSYKFNCLNDSVVFVDSSYDVAGQKIKQYKWVFHDNTFKIGKFNGKYKYNTAGNYKVSLIVFADTPSICSDTFTLFVSIPNLSKSKIVYSSNSICVGDTVQLGVTNICAKLPYTIKWSPSQYFSNSNSMNPSLRIPNSMWVKYVLKDANNSLSTDSVFVTVNTSCCVYTSKVKAFKENMCLGDTLNVLNANPYPNSQSKWLIYVNDVIKDSLISLNLSAYKPSSIGKYTFVLVVTGSCKRSESKIEVFVSPLPRANAGRDTLLCKTALIQIGDSAEEQHRYYWSPSTGLNKANISNPFAQINASQKYKLRVVDLITQCENYDSINIFLENQLASRSIDTSFCDGSTLKITAGVSIQGITYKWNDGGFGPLKSFSKPGRYTVLKTNVCGAFTDTFNVKSKVCFCDLFMPNAFSPDANAINEYFPTHYLDTIINLQIFNRWGEKLYDEKGTRIGWDGSYKGSIVEQDVYLYLIEYKNCFGRYIYLKGTFTLLR
jgi:gliding motility-associated-like protein